MQKDLKSSRVIRINRMNRLNLCLFEPEIPQNTGNVARTCAVTGASLHLIGPMGFRIDDAKLKRAGLDYWDKLDIRYYRNVEEFFDINGAFPLFFFTRKGSLRHTDVDYPDPVFLVFGKESTGLSDQILETYPDRLVRIPMRPTLRCLNLSNSVAIAAYEVLRQDGFDGLI